LERELNPGAAAARKLVPLWKLDSLPRAPSLRRWIPGDVNSSSGYLPPNFVIFGHYCRAWKMTRCDGFLTILVPLVEKIRRIGRFYARETDVFLLA
jgi:hypothetical protein